MERMSGKRADARLKMYIKKSLLASLIFMLSSVCAFAQLSTRENVDPSIFKVGTRPQQGNFGIYIGPSITEIVQMADESINWRGMPLLNFKYYSSDRMVFRLGLQIYNKSQGLKAKELKIDSSDFKNSKSKTYFMLTPAIEYHFTPKNICDVYVGANLPIGFSSNVEKSSYTLGKDKEYHNQIQNKFILGLGLFIGMQFFVADLPLAIGVEGGLSGLGKFGGVVKNVYNVKNADDVYEDKIDYTYDDTVFGLGRIDAKKIGTNMFELGADFRLTFSYYFSK